jgi:hypothetical protein
MNTRLRQDDLPENGSNEAHDKPALGRRHCRHRRGGGRRAPPAVQLLR